MLTASGVGVDRPDQLFVQLLCLTGAGMLLAALFDGIAASTPEVAMVDDTEN